ncbi:D-lactate dehydrogenase, CCG domain pair-containing subunit, putative [Citrifermentans bemidjiense Bem]|uniref:Glycolate oxidase iron-sulfur subunit n=1 Tax=Citrifermentans bemidjiense (strain ATCC BAA-1014 / DSM 16622 / JCM 12645 / Bem) TaxID=404380 RepID=B5EIV3_CITBB|nr:(Fe-S)-binding protein [Citrifermentans bemidjiense]ACH39908.1 D-lactate dehydrogenase, CCG domain pair-containing subunit, putative [Citrifermentans bemidjiense Bem]
MDYVKLINCMRCGMCLPHCPTYKETFLETASPRGRVALVRKLQEGELVESEKFLEYVSLCLDCQACASACPCGVNAGELVAEFRCESKKEKGLSMMEDLVLRKLVPHPDRLEAATAPLRLYQKTGLQQVVRSLGLLKLFPEALGRMEGLLPKLPDAPLRQTISEVTPAAGKEKGTAGFFLGCVMSLIFSEASLATVQLLSTLGYRVVTPKAQKCCGAPNMLGHDLDGLKEAASFNTDLFDSFDLDFVVTDCGGCGAELKKYGQHLDGERKAEEFSASVRDISEVLFAESEALAAKLKPLPLKVTYHDPCHIAHCQGIRSQPRALIKLIPGIDFRELPEADACCGSAGTYNIEKPEMADLVLSRKVQNVQKTGAEYLVTSNPGCLLQLKKALSEAEPQVRVIHLTELLQMSMNA